MLTKRIMRDDSVICVLFWMSLSQGMLALGLSLWTGFHWPGAHLWGWLLVIGVTGLSAHYALTSALALVPATVVAPMEFFRLPIISLLGCGFMRKFWTRSFCRRGGHFYGELDQLSGRAARQCRYSPAAPASLTMPHQSLSSV